MKEHPKQLDWDEIIEIVDQAKSPEWHDAMQCNGISQQQHFEMTYEESVAYFKRLENVEKIKHTNGPAPGLFVDIRKLLPVV